MRILVLGATGMLGQALVPVLRRRHLVIGLGSADCDIRDAKAVSETVRRHRPELVVNLAAFTDVDGCEKEPAKAEQVNGTGAGNIARACSETGAAMLHISSDYVFDGSKPGPYFEDDAPNPVSAYGHSKLLGEQEVMASLVRYFIVRTSWLFGQHGKNFVDTIRRIARQRPELRVVDDQRGSPTYTRHLAEKLSELIQTGEYGIFHVTGAGNCSWFEFAQSIIELSQIEGVRVLPVSSKEYVRPARRPANSVLANRHLSELHIGLAPLWKDGLQSYLDELAGEGNNDPAGKAVAAWKVSS
jgi:dTDP-4-dehydrorhamnose reductase